MFFLSVRSFAGKLLFPFFIAVFSFTFSNTGNAVFTENNNPMEAITGRSQPLLRVTYTSASKGELYACITCGTNSLGGLARRAKLLKDLSSSGVPLLRLGGSEEFLADIDINRLNSPNWDKNSPKNKHNEKEKARRLSLAYSALNLDLGWLSAYEKKWFSDYGIDIPKAFKVPELEPVTKLFDFPGGRVAVVLFPEGEDKHGSPSKKQINRVLEEGLKYKNRVNLLIGISPWGNVAEYRFLPEADGLYSILLGGGGGLGGPYVSDHSTESLLWIRSESHGRAVNVLDILELPIPGQKASWVEGLTFNAEQVFLFLKLEPDLEVEKLIGQSYDEWWQE